MFFLTGQLSSEPHLGEKVELSEMNSEGGCRHGRSLGFFLGMHRDSHEFIGITRISDDLLRLARNGKDFKLLRTPF